MNLRLFFKKLKKIPDLIYCSGSFSQYGEDLILDHLLSTINQQHFSYLDIGANHPCRLSNTFYFYRKGYSGVLIEPDPSLFRQLKRKRSKDIILNCGVSIDGAASQQTLYIMNLNVLNTFSQEEAIRIEQTTPYYVKETISIDVIPVDSIIHKYFSSIPFFLSIDTEGLDLDILKRINFSSIRPLALVAETLTFDPSNGGKKISGIIDFLISQNYLVFADTRCNTIFVDANILQINA